MNDAPLNFRPAAKMQPDLRPPRINRLALVLRTPSGLSGDMLVTGLSRLLDLDDAELSTVIDSLGLPELSGTVMVTPHHVNQISGWQAQVLLPQEHAHRSLTDILSLIQASRLSSGAQRLAVSSFQRLAEAESRVHGIPPEQIAFHEVGALDSILDICVAAALFDRLDPASFFCSPLPLCDGVIRCEHGLIASPAPAVQEMLAGVAVYGVGSQGETVTPTALAFLLAAGARFGPWPAMTVHCVTRAYGGRVLAGIPNGAIFSVGTMSVLQQ